MLLSSMGMKDTYKGIVCETLPKDHSGRIQKCWLGPWASARWSSCGSADYRSGVNISIGYTALPHPRGTAENLECEDGDYFILFCVFNVHTGGLKPPQMSALKFCTKA